MCTHNKKIIIFLDGEIYGVFNADTQKMKLLMTFLKGHMVAF